MSLFFRNFKQFSKFSEMVYCCRWASRRFPLSVFKKRDEVRDEKWQKRTAELVGGKDKRKKRNASNVESILNCLDSGSSNKQNSFTINKLPKSTTPRMKHLSEIFFDHIINLFQTREVCSDLADLGFEVTNVTAAPGLTSLIISWQAADPEKESQIVNLFPQSSSSIKQALASMRVIGHVPPIMFHKDMSQIHLAEINHLLSIADMGPKEDYISKEYELCEDMADDDQNTKHSKNSLPRTPNFVVEQDKKVTENAYGINYEKLKEELMNVKNKAPGKLTVESALDKKIIQINVDRV